jgi:hypothetical protein
MLSKMLMDVSQFMLLFAVVLLGFGYASGFTLGRGEFTASNGEFTLSRGEFTGSRGEFTVSRGEFTVSRGECTVVTKTKANVMLFACTTTKIS